MTGLGPKPMPFLDMGIETMDGGRPHTSAAYLLKLSGYGQQR